MPVKVKCSGCQKVLNAPDKARGKVVACPDCGTKIKIPSGDGGGSEKPAKPAKKAKPEPSASDSAEFLAAFNVDQLESEHGDEKVCPYCAADMAAEDTVCRKCGMNTATGQMDAKEAKKRSRKGPDPALLYSKIWSDSWEFLQTYWRLGLKTSLIWTTFLSVMLTCVFMARTWVFTGEEASAEGAPAPAGPIVAEGEGEGGEPAGPVSPWQSPGFFFWSGMAGVMFLGVPGWYWSLSLKIIDATLQKEEIKEDRIHYDMFEAVALGFRLFFWPAILMLPVLPILAGIAFTMGALAFITSGGSIGTSAMVMIGCYLAVPYLFFPQAMVHMTVRHRFKAWILWDQIVVFFKNAPATIYWWVVAISVWLPVIVILALIGLNLESAFHWTYEKLDAVAAWMFGFIMEVDTPDARPLFFAILFSLFLPVALWVCVAPFAFLAGFPAVFLMRANGNFGFYRRETLDLVTHMGANAPAGFWVRFLCHAIDYAILGVFHFLMFFVPYVLVASKFPLGQYFGGMALAAINLGFVAIAGSKDGRVATASLALGGITGLVSIYAETIEFFKLVLFGMHFALPLFNAWIYFATNEASTGRSTIGKEAFGLIVQAVDGRKELPLGKATVRHLGRIVSDALAGLPYVMCAFTPKKQALHDTMAKAEVVFRGDNK